MEMTGCPEDGVGVDDGARGVAVTSGHLNLFHLELGQYGAVLERYDGPMRASASPVAGLAAVG